MRAGRRQRLPGASSACPQLGCAAAAQPRSLHGTTSAAPASPGCLKVSVLRLLGSLRRLLSRPPACPAYAERAKESTLSVAMVAQTARSSASGAATYDFEYELESTRGRKRILSTGTHSLPHGHRPWGGPASGATASLLGGMGAPRRRLRAGGTEHENMMSRALSPGLRTLPQRSCPWSVCCAQAHCLSIPCSHHRRRQAVHLKRQHLVRQGELRRRGGAAAVAAPHHAVAGGRSWQLLTLALLVTQVTLGEC